MLRARGPSVPRGQLRWQWRRRPPQRPLPPREAGLGSVGAQARRVAGAVTLLVFGGVIIGCFGSPRGVDCLRYDACDPDASCSECFDVPGCGPLHVGRAAACEQSCPISFECSISTDCPAQIRCEGLVPGRRPLAAASEPTPGG
ncbi:MAG TPA: hypothetical protein VMG12_18505 [Polyangiaceae bacterium]|nr:hypothetical protein [Polyangiaceae bacterium]